jgi:hypothetical protein
MADKKISEFGTFPGKQDEETYYVVASGDSLSSSATNYKVPFTDLALQITGDLNLGGGSSEWSDGTTAGQIYYSGGNVGIGTITPSGRLCIRDVVNRNATNAQLQIAGGDGQVTTASHYIDNSSSLAKYIISQDIVGGEIRVLSSNNGVKLTSGATSWVPMSSDRRSKENISPLENVLEKVLQLSPSRYDYKDEHGGKGQIGFIAQEVEEVLPEFYVPGATEDEMSTVKFSDNATTALLVKAIQEQQELIEDLKSRIEALEG